MVFAQYADNSSLFLIIGLSLKLKKKKVHRVTCSLRNMTKRFLKCSHMVTIKAILKCSGLLPCETGFVSQKAQCLGHACRRAHAGGSEPADLMENAIE